jgi:hypothetical protein
MNEQLHKVEGTILEDAVMDLIAIQELAEDNPIVDAILGKIVAELESLKSWAKEVDKARMARA